VVQAVNRWRWRVTAAERTPRTARIEVALALGGEAVASRIEALGKAEHLWAPRGAGKVGNAEIPPGDATIQARRRGKASRPKSRFQRCIKRFAVI
jgi:hypothetical protein